MEIRFPILKQSTSAEIVEAELAAIEYTLASSITIRDRSDIRSLKHWSERLEPFEHQVENLITFCRRAPVALIADDVGMGKTISAGLIISELMVRKKIKRVLILAPKILLSQWCDELRDKFGVHAVSGVGNDLSVLAASKHQVVVSTYASALNRMDELKDADFDMLILDEAHKVRNLYGTPQAPKIASELRAAMAVGAFRYALLLTATPIHNRLWDIYSLIDILSAAKNHANPLGSPSQFAGRYLDDGKTSARRLVPSRIPDFRRIVGDYMVRTSRAGSGLRFPSREVKPVRCRPGDVEDEMEELVRESFPQLNILQKISLAEALMSSPSALASQLIKSAEAGQVSPTIVAKARRLAAESPLGCKAEYLLKLATELRKSRPKDWRMVVFTRRVATQRAIGHALEAMGASVGYIGGGHGATQDQSVRGFQAVPPTINAIVSTDAGAEGVNLQAGNVVVNYDLPWNPMVVEQRIGRVQRLGSDHASVIVMNLVVQGSVEELVVARLMEKLQLISAAIGDIEGILEVAGLDDGLEDDIKDLVLRALEGQDIEARTRQILENIERARERYDESKELVSETLGALRGMHTAGPAAPELMDVVPRLSVREFVSHYFREVGRVVERPEGRLLLERSSGFSHLGTFDSDDPLLRQQSGAFGGKGIMYYAEGEPPFERLVGELIQRRSHTVAQPEVDQSAIGSSTNDWMSLRLPEVKLDSHRLTALSSRFHGGVTALVTCSVAVDRLERLVEARSGEGGWFDTSNPSPGHTKPPARKDGQLDAGSWPDAVRSELEQAIIQDGSVRAFSDFYLARLAEEKKKAQGNKGLEEQVQRRFEPYVSAEVVSASGELQQLAEIEVSYSYPDGQASRLTLKVDGATGEVITEPPLASCAITNTTVPDADLGVCAVSGERALRHLLAVSSLSDSLMMPALAKTCEVSGDLLLPGEAVVSEFSSRTISPRHSVTCAVTQRLAASDEVGKCAFTGETVHVDSLMISEVSHRHYRADQGSRSAVSRTAGHASEFGVCEVSGEMVLPSELGRSDASGKMVRKDWLIPSEKNPERLASKGELVRCQATNKALLPDEVGTSEVSGLLVDKDLLVASALSQALALRSETFTCEESGALVLPLETETCALTGQRVRRDLVDTSGISGRTILKRLMTRCPESGLLGAPEEMRECEVTGLHVAPRELERCTVTGKMVVRRLLVQCAQCQGWLLRTEAETTDAGDTAHAHHVTSSAFSGARYLDSAVARCAASDLRLEPNALRGRFAVPLVEVGLACVAKAPDDSSVRSLADDLLGDSGIRVSKAWSRPSPKQSLDAVLAEGPRRLFGAPRRYAFFVDRASRKIVGRVSRVEIHQGGVDFKPLD